MNSRLPRVAVVGRQNVGKSTLVNRIHGRRESIAHESPGVTRDRIEVEGVWRGRRFVLIDTGGYVHGAKGIEAIVTAQADRAAGEADLALLVTDAQTGIQQEDEYLARKLRHAQIPVLVAANKVENDQLESDAMSFRRLGLGEPLPVSALHGRGSGDLLDRVVALLPETGEPSSESEPRFAIVGRPNVGKSSLFNSLVGEERSVVYEQAGTTRDSVDAMVEWQSGLVRFVDTAGLRREAKMRGVEYFSLVRTTQAIERAHVALLVLDAADGITAEDKKIASKVMEAGRGLVVSANKWDLLNEGKDATFKELTRGFEKFGDAPVARTSAVSGMGVSKLPDSLIKVGDRWSRRISTAQVNKVLEAAQAERPPPHGVGIYRYATQVSASPPSFVLFGGRTPGAAYQRFLENRLRRQFDLAGVPLRLKFKPKGKSRASA
ncbi:MAG: ribosome biogenesis GTPase Der [Actinomycetota bacterium]